jgi:flagellar protein FliS
MNPAEMAYRKTGLGGASGFSLLIALYDTLAGDLRRAAEAERRNDIEKRCREVNHALLVVAHLEDWINDGPGGVLAKQLLAFYASIRRKTIEAQVKRSPQILEQQMIRILEVRETWQKVEFRGTRTTTQTSGWVQPPAYPGSSPVQYERSSSGWSA